jgi:hypothetical protein
VGCETGRLLVLGPLPKLYRLVLATVSVVVFVAAGLWLGEEADPLTPPLGAVLGVMAGVLVAWAMVHDFHDRARPLRVRRHH